MTDIININNTILILLWICKTFNQKLWLWNYEPTFFLLQPDELYSGYRCIPIPVAYRQHIPYSYNGYSCGEKYFWTGNLNYYVSVFKLARECQYMFLLFFFHYSVVWTKAGAQLIVIIFSTYDIIKITKQCYKSKLCLNRGNLSRDCYSIVFYILTRYNKNLYKDT